MAMAVGSSPGEEDQAAMAADSTIYATQPLVSQTDTASVESEDEPIITTVSSQSYRSDKPRSTKKADIQPVEELAIPVVKATVAPETLELPKILRRKHSKQTSSFAGSRRVPIQYRPVDGISASLDDAPLDVLSLLQLELPL